MSFIAATVSMPSSTANIEALKWRNSWLSVCWWWVSIPAPVNISCIVLGFRCRRSRRSGSRPQRSWK